MAHLSFLICLFFNLLFCLCYGALTPLDLPNYQHKISDLNLNSHVVTVQVFGESLCPDTTNFFDYYFLRFVSEFENEIDVDISYTPFGKAYCKEVDNDFNCVCQHGQLECQLNALQNCVINIYKNFNDHFPIIHCIQEKTSIDDAASKCFGKMDEGMINLLSECAKGKEGRRLLSNAGNTTNQYAEGLNFVPWIVINGEANMDAYYSGMEKAVCKELSTFTTVPSVCKSYM
uniref:Gamma interferon inducible lysosomal thiol reductase GILT n=1 Tax=Strongyloides venezuelensis TaxID=75913 RepID=A0A0K0F6U3_STRVS